MRNLNIIAEELFNKIRGRFPSVTIGNDKGEVTNIPKEARYYDFDFKEGDRNLGKISISVDESTIAVMYSNDFVTQEDTLTKNSWYDFLKEVIKLDGFELYNEIRAKQAKASIKLIIKFLKKYPKIKSKKQKGKPTYFRFRNKSDSKLNINSSLIQSLVASVIVAEYTPGSKLLNVKLSLPDASELIKLLFK